MLRSVTRQLTRRAVVQPRIAVPLPRFAPRSPVPSLVRNYCPRLPPREAPRRHLRELEPIEDEEEDSEQTSEDDDMSDLAFNIPPEIMETLISHANKHWPKAATVPEGYSTDWEMWGLIATLWAPSPLFLRLPQAVLMLLRYGVKPWTGLVPALGEPTADTRVVMYGPNSFVVSIAGQHYSVDYALPDTRLFKLIDNSLEQAELLEEDPAGSALCDAMMERDHSVRQELVDQGYVSSLLEATTEEQEQSWLAYEPEEDSEEAKSKAETQLLKTQIDNMLIEMGITPPEDPEEWAEKVQEIGAKLEGELGDTDLTPMKQGLKDVENMTSELVELKKQVELAEAEFKKVQEASR